MKIKSKILIILLTFILTITASVYTSVTFSKYVKNSSQGAFGSVAVPVVQFSGLNKNMSPYILLLDAVNPTTDENDLQYSFNVNNYLDEVVTEVALRYTITLSTTNNIPLIITLKREGADLITLNTGSPTATSIIQTLNPGISQSNAYNLKIMWNPLYTQSDYSGLIDQLTISINWEQIN